MKGCSQMKKTNIFRRTLALTLAAVMQVTVSSCQHKNGDSAASDSDTSADLKSAEEKYYFPITNQCFYDEKGKPTWRETYEFSPEGYLLAARHYGKFYGEQFDDTLFEMDVETYRYDEAGRLIEEYRGYEYPSCGDDDVHYDKVTTVYHYDEKGRMTGSEQKTETFVMRDVTKDFSDDNLRYESESVMRSECVITENDETGGWKSEETFYYISHGKTTDTYTDITEYDAEGNVVSSIKNDRIEDIVTSARYQYDDKGRPASVFNQYLRDGKEIGANRVEVTYDNRSRIVRQRKEKQSEAEEILYEYDDLNRLTKRLTKDSDWNFTETVTYFDEGTAVREDIPPSDLVKKTETRYAALDENGNYHEFSEYGQNQNGMALQQRITREYGDKIPRGCKFGTAGVLAENERLLPLDFSDSYFYPIIDLR